MFSASCTHRQSQPVYEVFITLSIYLRDCKLMSHKYPKEFILLLLFYFGPQSKLLRHAYPCQRQDLAPHSWTAIIHGIYAFFHRCHVCGFFSPHQGKGAAPVPKRRGGVEILRHQVAVFHVAPKCHRSLHDETAPEYVLYRRSSSINGWLWWCQISV